MTVVTFNCHLYHHNKEGEGDAPMLQCTCPRLPCSISFSSHLRWLQFIIVCCVLQIRILVHWSGLPLEWEWTFSKSWHFPPKETTSSICLQNKGKQLSGLVLLFEPPQLVNCQWFPIVKSSHDQFLPNIAAASSFPPFIIDSHYFLSLPFQGDRATLILIKKVEFKIRFHYCWPYFISSLPFFQVSLMINWLRNKILNISQCETARHLTAIICF